MNLKEALTSLTDEELSEMLKDIKVLQEERQKEKEEPKHYYEFTGTWSWGIWAKSKEEAVECFKESYFDEIEILTDEYKVEQYE